MQKQVNFFERHVEWFALGLGGLFLLVMVFQYVMNAPVKETVGGEQVSPGEIDRKTLAGPIEKLRREIANPTIPEIRQEEYVERFVAAIQGLDQPLPQLAGNQIHWRPPYEVREGPGGVPVPGGLAGPPVTELPKPPPAVFSALSQGRSRVVWQDPNWVPRRAGELPKMIEADKDWWSGAWTIDGEALLKAFQKAFDEKKIDDAFLDPAAFMQTAILDVQLERRQVLPGGKVGKTEIIKPLQNSLKPPFPGKNARDVEINEYIKWVTQAPLEIVEPVFYEVKVGDQYVPPSVEAEQLAAEMRNANQEQKKLLLEQQRQLRLQQRNQQQFRGRAPFDEGMMEEDMMDDGIVMPRGPRGRGVFPPPMPVRPPGAGVRPRVGVGAAPAPQPMQVTAGRFAVQEGMPEIRIIAHDDTVEPGKTYQYRIRYQILNPVFKSNAAPPELAKEFAIPSEKPSAWSRSVTIRAKVEFFIAKVAGDKAEFDVYTWREGLTRKSTITVGAGDAIAGTGWSLVDARGTGRKAYCLVVEDASGYVDRRAPDADSNSPRKIDLDFEVESATAQVGLNR